MQVLIFTLVQPRNIDFPHISFNGNFFLSKIAVNEDEAFDFVIYLEIYYETKIDTLDSDQIN